MAADEAERLADEISDCIDRGDCDPSDYPSNSEGLWEIISNPYYIILVITFLILTNLDWFKSKKTKEEEKRNERLRYLSNQCHRKGKFVEGLLTEEELNEYLELNQEDDLKKMPKTTEDYRRRHFFWLEELRIKEELGPGGYFEFEYLFEEFKDELFRKYSWEPDEYDRYRYEIKTAEDYIKDYENRRKKRIERIKQAKPHNLSNELELIKKKIEDWYETVPELMLNDELTNRLNEFKTNLFNYIDLHLKTYTSKIHLIEFCKNSTDGYLGMIETLKEDNKRIPKKVKDEINAITMEIFNKVNVVSDSQLFRH